MMTPVPHDKARLEELRELIDQYSYEYHVNDEPSVSDAVYDSLFGEIKQIGSSASRMDNTRESNSKSRK